MAVDTVARVLALGATGSSTDAYTKSETDTLLSAKADLVNGTVPLSQIPPAAIERIVTVANDTARFALTTAEVQLGDTVKVTATNKMYFVIDTDHLDGELGYQVYVAGKAAEAVADQSGNVIDTTYVKVVSGKQLSTEDYTTAEKTKLAGLENYDDSAVRSQIGKLVDAGAKNLLKINTESRAIFTSDLMNTVTCSGTSDGNAFINLNYVDDSTATIPPGNWVVAGFGDMSHLRFRYTENEAAAKATGEYGSPLRFTVPSSGVTLNYLRLENKEAGQVFDNVVLKIMLCTAEDYENSPEFVPYAPTNRELYEMILALQNKE